MNSNTCSISPPIKELNDFNGNTDDFFDGLNKYLEDSFINNSLYLNNKKVDISQVRDLDNRLERFWHIVSHTDYFKQEKTFPDMDRCRAIYFIPFLIQNCNTCTKKLVFERKEKDGLKTYIWCTEENIMIVLATKPTQYYFITCFIVKGQRNIEKYQQRYQEYKSNTRKTKNGYSK